MSKQNQTVFYLENLDFDWLPTRSRQWLARLGLALLPGLLGGLLNVGGLLVDAVIEFEYGLLIGACGGLLGGILVGLSSMILKIQPVEKTGFRRADLSSSMGASLRSGLRGGLLGWLVVGLPSDCGVGLASDFTPRSPSGCLSDSFSG